MIGTDFLKKIATKTTGKSYTKYKTQTSQFAEDEEDSMKKIKYLCFLGVFSILSVTGCSAMNNKSAETMADYAVEQNASVNYEAEMYSENAVLPVSGQLEETPDDYLSDFKKKEIKTAKLSIETKDFENDIEKIQALCEKNGGYIENSSVSGGGQKAANLRANYTFRIPQSNLNPFLKEMKDGFTIAYQSMGTEDISYAYYDTEARLESLRIQQKRLNELLEEAKGLEDIILLNQQLSNVEYQIESLTGTIKRWDDQVEYATVFVDITSLSDLELGQNETGFGTRIRNGWDSSLRLMKNIGEGIIILFVFLLPYLLVAGVLTGIILFIVRRKKKSSKK